MNNNISSPLAKALDHYQTAEHLFYITFPVTKDPKLLLAIVKSISNCLEYTLETIFSKEKMPAPEGLAKKINALRPLTKKYSLNSDNITFMLRIHEILYQQKQSPMEFKRGNTHIICSDSYDLEVVSTKDVEEFLQSAKKILHFLKST
ncbi:MAG: hypothetical protein Q7S55_01515 [Nanoarchaeota archaeon]|nr:hypothetical protein [Nanoarchaeota archaeon]